VLRGMRGKAMFERTSVSSDEADPIAGVVRWLGRYLAGALLWLVWVPAAWAADTATPPGPVLVLEAAQGIKASTAAARWLADLEGELSAAKAKCPAAAVPTLDPSLPSMAFRVPVSPARPVVYSKDSVVNRLVMIARDGRGCPWGAVTGRSLPFGERSLLSPLANLRLPLDAPAQEVTVVIQDGKTLRPWLRVAAVETFDRDSRRLWVLLGAYTGAFAVLLIIGLGLRRAHPGMLANAYCVYIIALMVYQLQALGIGPAWIPGWPQGDNFAVMQGATAAAVMASIAATTIAFLRPKGTLRLIIIGGMTLGTGAFLTSGWYPPAYRIGALIVMLMAIPGTVLLVLGLRTNEPWVRWFAVGMVVMFIGGGAQMATVVFNGAGLGTLGSFVYIPANLVDSACWLISLFVRFNAERAKDQARLLHDATHDRLTGLPNRAYLTAWMNTGAAAAGCRGLVLIDLDRFKAINDNLGYAAGDGLLIAVARLLGDIVPPTARVIHLGADVFAILLHRDDAASDAQAVAMRIVDRLRKPIALKGGSVHVRASMGVVRDAAADCRILDILRDADSAMNLAKVGGGNRSVDFQPVMRAPALKRFRLEQDLVEALSGDEFQVFYQPIVALADQRAVGMEALIRWHQPRQGWLSPADFIPVAEETGLIVQIGAWVLWRTAVQIQEWKLAGRWRPGFYVSVNLSGNQLLDDALIGHLDAVILRGGLSPGELRLELTETAVIANIGAACDVLPALRERRIPLCMDDFGTGYSSLSYLNELPFDVLKIDRSFVTGIEARQESQVLVRTILALAQSMGLQVVAEGVETEAQAALLLSMGCPYGQGYHFARPLPAGQAGDWLS
jgi:diguanylate cyclase (GGDEF)-like protein